MVENIIKTCCQTQTTKEFAQFPTTCARHFLATFAHKFIDLPLTVTPRGCTFAFILMQFSRAIRRKEFSLPTTFV